MVVVGVDGGGGDHGRRRHAQVVGALLHHGAQLAQLGGHGGDAVGLLDAPAGDVAQRAGAVGIQRGHGDGHGDQAGDPAGHHRRRLRWQGHSRPSDHPGEHGSRLLGRRTSIRPRCC